MWKCEKLGELTDLLDNVSSFHTYTHAYARAHTLAHTYVTIATYLENYEKAQAYFARFSEGKCSLRKNFWSEGSQHREGGMA